LPEKGIKMQQFPTKCKQRKVARREVVEQKFSKPSGGGGVMLQRPYSQTTKYKIK
jgi:hypothetical protein